MNELTTTTQQQQRIFEVIELANLAPRSKAQYARAVERALAAGVNFLDYNSVQRHYAAVPTSERAFLSAALRRYYGDVRNQLRMTATTSDTQRRQKTDMLDALAALLETTTATREKTGQAARQWLTLREVARLRQTINGRTGRRDAIAVGLLLSAGLRRDEAVNLRWQDVTRQGERTVLHVVGKGDKQRDVPISESFANLLQAWREFCEAGDIERVLRGLAAGGTLTDSLTAAQLFNIVRKWAKKIGRPELSPHDLRRTYARLAYENGVDIAQVSLLLGHADVKTTMLYIGAELNLDVTASDCVPW